LAQVKLDEAWDAVPWAKRAVPSLEEDAAILEVTERLIHSPNSYAFDSDLKRSSELPSLAKAQADMATIQSIEHELANARQALPTLHVDIGRLSERLTEMRGQLEKIAQRSFGANVEGCQFAINESERRKANLENLIGSLNQTIKTTSGVGMGLAFFFAFLMGAMFLVQLLAAFVSQLSLGLLSLATRRTIAVTSLWAVLAIAIVGAILGSKISRDNKNRPHRAEIEKHYRSIGDCVRTLATARARLEVWKQNLYAFQAWQSRRTPPLPLPAAR